MSQDTPATPSPQAAAMEESWAMISALMGGTFAMRQAGQKYLPKHPAESQEAYDYRKSVSTLYGALRRTIETMSGKPFAEPIKISEDMPAVLSGYCDDIDLEGRDLQAFSHAVFRTAMAYGLSHILVDYPKVQEARTRADEQAIGARPYFVHVDPRNVLGWRAERINGVQTLTQLRMLECVTEPDGEWGEKSIQQVRVLEPTRFAIYRKNDREEWVLFEQGQVSIGVIPLATVYTHRTGFMTAAPPLMDLAHLNVEHWQSSSDQSNILHVARVPILFAAGFAEGALKIAANAAVSNDDPASKLSYVEHTGAAIGAGQESLDKLEERMSVMGLELLVSQPGSKTATEASIDTAESTSALAAMVQNLEDSLALAMSFAAKWANLPTGGTVDLEGDFTKLDPLDVQSLVAAKGAGILSAETIFNEMQKLGMVDEELTWEEEKGRLAAETAQASSEAASHTALQTAAAAPETGGGTPQSPVAAAPDFAPLLESIGSLVAALGKPESEPAEPMDFAGLIEAIKAQPAPIINVAAPVIPPAQITVEAQPAPVINIAPPAITVEAAQVNVTPPAVTVESPTINLPAITMPPVNVTVEKGGNVKFTEDANGNITGAVMN